MLAWYDVTSSLVSRRGPIFPRRFIQSLMTWRFEAASWSLLALNGFPDEHFLDLYDIAQAASRDADEDEIVQLERRLLSTSVPLLDATSWSEEIASLQVLGRRNPVAREGPSVIIDGPKTVPHPRHLGRLRDGLGI